MQNKSKSPFKIAFSKFIHNKIAMLSVIFLLIITIVSIIAPLIAPFPVNQQDLLNIKGEMTAQNILGTDSGGRDNFSRLLYAGRISLSIGITSTIGMLLIGITVGVISGYFGGIVDTLLMRITEFVMLFPFLIFAIVLNAALGDKIKNPYGSAILSFLGFGISKAIPSWGNMLSDAQEGDVISGKPWIWMPPAIMITLTILSINFVGEGIKDAFNPRGRR
ncbi:TPA: ABC transporter permease [Staphylococcus aureus]